MDITKLLMSQMGSQGLEMLSKNIGADSSATSSALEGIVPSLLGAMTSNAQSSDGASGFLSALDRDHDGSVLNDISGFLGNSGSSSMGEGILKHVMGSNQAPVAESLGAKTGMSSSQIMSLMKYAAPLVMGFLGKQRKENPTAMSSSGIGSILSGLTGASDSGTGLDLGDILSVVGSFSGNSNNNSSSSGVGGLLKGLFGG